uniref:Elongation of very long chain fatty acids protein n=1 Tax=Timema monikensis TaxID=170555 RepID=A0A7R9E2K9_9NEOP|nr:unnamed protein product [Timema monikensis]
MVEEVPNSYADDPRTIDWFLVRNPIYLVIIMMTFVYFIQYLGPKFMMDRNPFDLSRLIMIFNVTQIVYNVWMFNECGDNISLCVCSQMANVCWHYYMSKIIDLLDTVFFVLRKKNNQITPLHVLHHTGMPIVSFSCVRYYPGGHVTLTGPLNTFVHSIMYFYYLIAGLGPSFKKYLWWKQYLTLLQMVSDEVERKSHGEREQFQIFHFDKQYLNQGIGLAYVTPEKTMKQYLIYFEQKKGLDLINSKTLIFSHSSSSPSNGNVVLTGSISIAYEVMMVDEED